MGALCAATGAFAVPGLARFSMVRLSCASRRAKPFSAVVGEARSGRRSARAPGTCRSETMNTLTHGGFTDRVGFDERDNLFVGRIRRQHDSPGQPERQGLRRARAEKASVHRASPKSSRPDRAAAGGRRRGGWIRNPGSTRAVLAGLHPRALEARPSRSAVGRQGAAARFGSFDHCHQDCQCRRTGLHCA